MMTKQTEATPAYNVLFQSHEDGKDDHGQSCHVFALGSQLFEKERHELNTRFCAICTVYAMPLLMEGLPTGAELRAKREELMGLITALHNEQETALEVNEMYLCGGFRGGQLAPEHMWIEDKTHKRTYDTFIDRPGIAVRYCTGEPHRPFLPGCEAARFEAADIVRVKVSGYTMGQLIAIAAGAERFDSVRRSVCQSPFAEDMGAPKALEAAKAVVADLTTQLLDTVEDINECSEEERSTLAAGAMAKYKEQMELEQPTPGMV